MKERPILFSGPMILAILDGSKTQTRRVVKQVATEPSPALAVCRCAADDTWIAWWGDAPKQQTWQQVTDERYPDGGGFKCPHGKPGDRLWVRETWAIATAESQAEFNKLAEVAWYRADGERDIKWRPSIFMPRWASRITLEIVNVRVERLQEVSESDALAEGIQIDPDTSHCIPGEEIGISDPVEAYAYLWDRIHGIGSWGRNDWVWVIEFKRLL